MQLDEPPLSRYDGGIALHGVPTWVSAAIEVKAGEVLTLTSDVRTDGVSSAPSVGVTYLGAAGEVLQTVILATAALRTDGFETLEGQVKVPAGVAEVRVVLSGFPASDLRTSGAVTFDEIGLFAE